MIFGLLLGPDFSTSVIPVKRLIDGNVPGYPKLCFGAVNVRDVVNLHLRAIEGACRNGQRLLQWAATSSWQAISHAC